MINLNTNLSSLIAQTSLKNSTLSLNQAIERMSTGFKINHASDNAANYSISTSMTTKIGAYQVAEENAAMGLDMLTTANKSLELVSSEVQRLRALAEQAANGTYGADSLKAIQSEADSRVAEVDRILRNTEYNDKNLFLDEPVLEGGFIVPVSKRDTSSMQKIEEVASDVKLAKGTYSISTAAGLAKLSDMASAGLITTGSEFVLDADIDLKDYDNWNPISIANCTFDGNGHVVKNLRIDGGFNRYLALFSNVKSVKNLGVEDAYVKGDLYCSIIAARITSVDNCYVTGELRAGRTGTLCNDANTITNSYSTADIYVYGWGGGLAETLTGKCENSYMMGRIISNNLPYGCGGLFYTLGANASIENCFVTSEIVPKQEKCVAIATTIPTTATVKNCYWDKEKTGKEYGTYTNPDIEGLEGLSSKQLYEKLLRDELPQVYRNKETRFQIGIDSSVNSFLSTELKFYFKLDIDLTNSESARQALTDLDSLYSRIQAKQTEFGALSNRLDSVLDEINIQYENLVSSRSTLRDADVAKVSASYIQQQILQQASATLLATANQSPSIALQLI